ncbi:GGDEF domain-containing protein [Demequina salsinemoris]|uniref:GGDEF domain-containing protein n=1 Tax=Demequina salsinemoris TaxID=577470 RepID=UPI00078406BF|nr:GGDEF domain-containing protein [Demequina salsinemoris]
MRTISAEARVLATVLLMSAASVATYLAGGPTVGSGTVTAMSLVLTIATLGRVRRTSGLARRVYAALLAGYVFQLAASALWFGTFASGTPEDSTHLAVHALMGVGYLFLLVAAVLVIRRSARHGLGGVLDATTLTVATTSALWQASLAPVLGMADAAPWQRWQILIVTTTLIGAIGVVVGLRATGGVPRSARPVKWYFAVALLITVTGNVLETVLADPATRVAPEWIGVLWPVAFAATWGAIVHPAGPDAFEIIPQRTVQLTSGRIFVLGVAMMTTPIIVITRVLAGGRVDVLSGAIASVVVTSLVLTRISQLAASHRDAESRLRFLADHDMLTGLPNRRAVDARIEALTTRVRAGDSPGIVVWFIDLDGFKEINDTRGHAAGDELLVAVSERLGVLVRSGPKDLVGRLGGDEFIVVVEGCPEIVSEPVTARIHELFGDIFVLSDGPAEARASIGSAAAGPGDAPTLDSLLTRADHAMYRHKARSTTNGSD